uniref:Ribosomal protein L32 n=1 Tax=Plagiorhegma dubium TaxID=168834 RepID=A0A344A0T0_9MAGN|nr:ribosomal protein L32 [Plagiorhegma dubium]AWT58340.1 ribosomal protein L32 [Plagiorhegma dubium]QBZ77688.1 ribosomal protein L32 [Plagiorhegma dubium]
MAVQKKHTSISNISKKRIRKNIFKMKGYRAARKKKRVRYDIKTKIC